MNLKEKTFVIDLNEIKGNLSNEIPSKSIRELSTLDEKGIVKEGMVVRPNGILVGLVKEAEESEMSAQEKLIRTIFSENGPYIKNVSMTNDQNTYTIIKKTTLEENIVTLQTLYKMISKEERDKTRELTQQIFDEIKKMITERTRIRKIMSEHYRESTDLIFKACDDVLNKWGENFSEDELRDVKKYTKKYVENTARTTWLEKAVMEIEWLTIKHQLEKSVVK